MFSEINTTLVGNKVCRFILINLIVWQSMIDIKGVIDNLASIRPIFHSEADFQHALAWEIHHKYPESKARLEYKPPHTDERCYIDIWVKYLGINYAIELKYKTRELHDRHDDEVFDLLDQSAQDCGRYDVCKDIGRIEKLVNKDTFGFVVFLTNDCSYWKVGRNTLTEDFAFRLYEGKELSGTLQWKETAARGTIRGREKPICLNRQYKIYWNDYSVIDNSTYGKFRYLLITDNKLQQPETISLQP